MKRIPGVTLALAGLIVGISCGLALSLFKNYLIAEIVQAMEEEVTASCDCSLSFDSFSLSFATLSGRAKNVRILEKGVPKLTFKTITASFSISQIRDKIIDLDKITLVDGSADGVGPDSVTFRFIDRLTTPPEIEVPGRWRAILKSLEIKDARFREPLGERSELVAKGVSLQVRKDGENFALAPHIDDLRYRTIIDPEYDEVAELPLGAADASLVIEDLKTVFHSLTLGREVSSIAVRATVDTEHKDVLAGEANYSIDSQYIGLPEWLLGNFSGSADVRGSLGSPILSGTVSNKAGAPFTLAFPNAAPLQIETIKGDLNVDVNHGDPIVTVRALTGSGGGSSISSSRPLTFSDEGLDAGFTVTMPTFSYGPFTVRDARASVSVTSSGGNTTTEFMIQTADLQVQQTTLGPARIRINLKPNSVETKVESTDQRIGSFSWQGEIDLTSPEPELRNGTLNLSNYRQPLTIPISEDRLSPVAITSKLALSGPLNLMSMRGEGPITVAFPALPQGLPLSGKAILKNGSLEVSLPESSYHGSANLNVDLARSLSGELTMKLPSTPFSRFFPNNECGALDAALNYKFALSKPLGGSGNLSLENLHFGCEPYSLRFTRNASLPISNGSILFKNVSIAGANTLLSVSGSIGINNGYNIDLGGEVFLSSFLSFFSSMDDLNGKIDTRLTIRGPLSKPLFGGRARLTEGELGLSSPEVEIHGATGSFNFTGPSIQIEKLRGEANGGTFEVRGNLLPFDISASTITTHLEQVTIEPIADSTITFSGDLNLGSKGRTRQTLDGQIAIEFAEITKRFDLNQVLAQTLAGYFIPSRIQPRAKTSPVNLDLDVRISAPRNIFVLTPFFSAELNAQIAAQGTVAQPSLSGNMQVLSGWVGVKDNRFDITSGSVNFKPGSLMPSIELSSEGSLRTSNGESILVIVEATGPLQNPRINLSSDRGLSHEEILDLITSSRAFGGQTMANRGGVQFNQDQRFFFSEDTFSSIGAFLRGLTRIDTLSLEPIYNPFTGSIEPAVVAKKNITSRLALVGNNTFSSLPNSRAGAVYNLTPSVNVSAFVQSMPSRQQTALSSDLTYTILSEQAQFVALDVEGVSAFDKESVLSAARLGLTSRIRRKPESLESIQRDVVQYMNQQGFLAAKATVDCLEGDDYCKRLRITVDEGSQSTIQGFVFTTENLPIPAEEIVSKVARIGSLATSSTIDAVERKLTIALRNEGYIAARVTPKFVPGSTPQSVNLSVTIDSKQPIGFVFRGNTVFSDSEFLDSIQLFSRKRPFGNNTINLLIQNIERMYREEGYLFARVSFEEDRSNPKKLTYLITITEQGSTSVKRFNIHGNDHVPLTRIKQVMSELGYKEEVDLLTPEYAVPDQLDALKEILVTVFNQEGYPSAKVDYTIEPSSDGSKLSVIFTVEEGEPRRISSIKEQGFPKGVKAPEIPQTPTSLPRVNRYMQKLLECLTDEGFLYPALSSHFDPDSNELQIEINPGARVTIQRITYDGLASIQESVAREYTTISTGSPYRTQDINNTKHKLLRSGLFSRVEVVPADGALDSSTEGLIIRLAERPLQTLEIGAGANSELGIHAFGEAVDKSLFADGRSLALRLDSYFDQQSLIDNNTTSVTQGFASLRYMDPTFWDSDYTFTEDLRFQRQELPTQEWDLDRISAASYVLRQYGDGISFSAGHTFLVDNLQNVTPGAKLTTLDEGTVRLSFLSGLFSVDRRDDPLVPHSGYALTLEPKFAMNGLGSEATYGSINASASGMVPLDALSRRFSLGLRLLGGIAQAFGPTDEIPITQRFYLGGRTTVRGFRQNSLGPRSSDGAVIGGDALLAGNTQFQYLLADSFSTHIFFDFGNVFLRNSSVEPLDPTLTIDQRGFALSDLRTSMGAGFQYLSPIGPIGFDIGFPLDERQGEPSVRVHFSVGSSF